MIKKFTEWLYESATKKKDKNKTYDYGCSMLYFDFPGMKKLHEAIPAEDVHDEGLETEPHVTLLYGLHSDEIEDSKVIEASKGEYETITLHNLSLFENEKYDVLKFDVKGDGLHAANKRLSKLPHTTNFPDYHPHCTVGYLMPGKGKKVLDILKDFSDEFKVKLDKANAQIVYSKPGNSEEKTKIRVEL
jgi:2'-5' RNA ligase